MTIFLAFALAVVLGIYMLNLFLSGNIPQLVRSLRWIVGGGAVAIAALLGFAGRVGIASMLGMAGGAILLRGRLGPIDFNSVEPAEGATSRVKSRYFDMQLDHDNGAIHGRIIAGQYRGRDLMELDQDETGTLLAEVGSDTDSISLLEAWLDANRTGWRDYFDATTDEAQNEGGGGPTAAAPQMDARQAREILGVSDDAGPDEIKAAHHRLLKSVHPDQGGSNYLAARINAAKDFLLKH